MSEIATKLIWSVTPFGVEKQGLESVFHILHKNNLSIVRATYSQYTKKIVQDLKQLAHQNDFDPTFMFELVGRRCLICVPEGHFIFNDADTVNVQFDVDFDFCAKNTIAKSRSETIEMKVSSADQLNHLKLGSLLNISYGSVRLSVTNILEKSNKTLRVECKVLEGGSIFSGVKVHSPDIPRHLFPLLPEDENSVQNKFFNQADYLVVSGLKSEEELLFLKKSISGSSLTGSERHPSVAITPEILNLNTELPPRFLLKVGSKSSLELMPKLLHIVDGVFLSRSELGLDENPLDLGILQKEIIEICNKNAKVIIVSSELMQSMRQNATPTRAEVSDMANAMEDGADALVLSFEVTHGSQNSLVAKFSHDVLLEAEEWKTKKWENAKSFSGLNSTHFSDDDVITYGAMRIAEQENVSAIVCFTEGGYTAYKLSALRTPKTIIAITCNKRIFRQLNLLRSVEPEILDEKLKTEKLLSHIKNILKNKFNFKSGEKFVFVSMTTSSVSERNSNLFTLQEC